MPLRFARPMPAKTVSRRMPGARPSTSICIWVIVRGRAAEIWVDPEIDQGFGLSGTFGVAGFPSAEA